MKLKIALGVICLLIVIFIAGLFNKPYEYNDSSQYLPPVEKSNYCNEDCIKKGDTERYEIPVDQSGNYNLMIDYTSSQNIVNEDSINLNVNNKSYKVALPKKFVYDTAENSYDRYGNEITRTQDIIQQQSVLNVNDNLNLEDFKLNAGIYDVSIESLNNDLEINNVYFEEDKSAQNNASNENSDVKQIVVEAENFSYKNESSIAVGYLPDNHVSPVSTSNQVNNIVKGDTFNESLQSLSYVVDAPKAGNYKLALNGRNELPAGKNVYLNIYVNGELSEENTNIQIPSTSDFEVYELEKPIYLQSGENTITLELRTDIFDEDVELIDKMVDDIDQLKVEIQRVTGGTVDENRSWELSSYIPDLNDRLNQLNDDITTLSTDLSEKFGTDNEITNSVDLMQQDITLLIENSDDLPNYMTSFSDGSSSIRGLLIKAKSDLLLSNYSIDKLLLVPEESSFDYYNPNFANSFTFEVERLFGSFSNSTTDANTDSDVEIEVWVKRPRQYVDVMQKMIDEEFTPETGISVNLSIITDQNKLTMANAAGMTPDVAMSLDTWYIYQLGLRGGLYDFTENPEETADIVSNYKPGGLNQLIINGGLYGLPETQDFYVMYYRTDIFESNGYEIPETWSDVIELLPALQSQGMDFYIPSSNATSLKTLPTTGYFFLQNEAELFSEDGLSVNFTGEKQQESLNFMVDLYTRYGIEKQVPNFYDSFRDGSVPIGISNFGTYVQLTNAAPEIEGDWSIALVPGVDNGDEIVRWMPGGTGAQASVIFEGSENKEASLEFLSWWNSTEVQTEYIQYLIASYGGEYMWNSSNINAFATLPISQENMDVILEQADWIYDIPLTPANYYVERSISDIWNAAVFDGESVRVESDYQEEISNQELKKRYQEFGYVDEKGNKIKDYPIPNIKDTERWIQENGN